MIYMNHAATSYKRPPCVAEAVIDALSSMGNEYRGTSVGEMTTARTIYGCRQELARLFGFSHPERVVLTANATTAMNMALFGILHPGDEVIATDWDHNCVLRPLHVLEKRGVQVNYWRTDRDGRLHTDELKKLLEAQADREEDGGFDDCTPQKVLVCTHASNLTGRILDLAAVSVLAKQYGWKLIVDASQTAGAYPIDMDNTGIDVLVFTGHKSLMGPQGTGGMCVAEDVEIRPLISGGTGFRSYEPAQPEAYPAHLEAGTQNGHGIAGLGAAVGYILEQDPARIHLREMELTVQFLEGIRDIPGIRIYGWDLNGECADAAAHPKGKNYISEEHTPVVPLNLRDIPSEDIADILSERYGIAVRAGAHCAPRMHMALGTKNQGAVRFSFGYFNTEEEIDAAVTALREIASEI